MGYNPWNKGLTKDVEPKLAKSKETRHKIGIRLIGNKSAAGLIWMSNDNLGKNKRVKSDIVDELKKSGWIEGRLNSTLKNISNSRKGKASHPKGTFLVPRETRTCDPRCGCGKTFVCKVSSPKMFFDRSHIVKTEAHKRNVLKSVCARPNKNETRGIAYLEYLYPGRFAYTGDGTCLVNGRSADAVDLKTRTIALINGTYWHCSPRVYKPDYYNKSRGMTAQQIWDYDAETVRRFAEAGYRTIVIWEDELDKVI